ncbi:hypothetical protein Rai3103_08930 [Raineyella fluvialis]|uniref:Uncharacterized protein n=2 Tax=Raineyella fluvialis TaxID=2662261 RepID=A0A5Q2FDB7_9ACTN|nr:hypothetical protein Rai3103_08930 [Raineyella fluvialis]
MHDGGADGIILRNTSQIENRPTHFLQASIEKDAKSKIKKTIAALQKNGRTVHQLTYITSQQVPKLDLIEQEISDEISVGVRIRDREYIIAHLNDSSRHQAIFREDFGHYLEHLRSLGSAPLPTQSAYMRDPTVFVFLRQQSDREEDEPFMDSVTDALSLWALHDTDPDNGQLMSAQDVLNRVLEVLPSIEGLLTTDRILSRLKLLSAKSGKQGRQVRWYKASNEFALPFETRQQLSARNADDEALQIRVVDYLTTRAEKYCEGGVNPKGVGSAALVALQKTFESRGLQFSAFLSSGETSPTLPDLDEPVRSAVDEASPGPALRENFFIATLATVRDCLYNGGDDEREYLRRLAKTYSMLFVLRQDPKVVEYLEDMTSNFTLYVGTDLLVLAMSERYLDRENQSATNLLGMAQSAGARLILTEPVLEEVVTHLRAADREFEHYYSGVEGHLPTELYGEIPKIMIRSYFYNRTADH